MAGRHPGRRALARAGHLGEAGAPEGNGTLLTSRNTAPYPDGRTGDATAAVPPAPSGGVSRHPASSTTPARAAPTALGPRPRTRIVVPPENPRPQRDRPPPGHARQRGRLRIWDATGRPGDVGGLRPAVETP
ncbi:hypothetical protein SALBM217S_10236 [Streptomyces griseoloalbus]